MKPILLFILAATCIDFAYAKSDIYVCTNPDGTKTYSNTGSNKGCKKVDLPGLTVVPAPNKTNAGKTSTHFPAIDNVTQKSRDVERRQILQDELKAEQQKLTDLNAQYKNGQPDRLGSERNYAKYQERTETLKVDIDRSQQNVEALQREIGNLGAP